MKRVDMTGKEICTLTVIKMDEERHENDMKLYKEGKIDRVRVYWLCECSKCGKTYSIRGENLRSGNTKGCQCDMFKRIGDKQKKQNEIVYQDESIVKFKSSNTDDVITVDADKYDEISKYCWYVTNFGYAMTRDVKTKKQIMLHRLLVFGYDNVVNDEIIDHANRDRLDDRLCNLRVCEPSDNAKNQSLSARNTSGQTGVSYSSQFHKWRAYVCDKRKYISLGYYKTKEEAIAARLAGEKKYYGEFAPSLN